MSSPEVTLRRAEPPDALCLGVLATQVYLDTYATSGIRPAIAREVRSSFGSAAVQALLAREDRSIWLAECEEHVVGFCEVVARTRHALVAAHPSSELARLYVQRPFHGRGVGRSLLRHAESVAAEHGASAIWLTAWVGNDRALAFYRSHGYRRLGATRHVFEGEAVENWLLIKNLER